MPNVSAAAGETILRAHALYKSRYLSTCLDHRYDGIHLGYLMQMSPPRTFCLSCEELTAIAFYQLRRRRNAGHATQPRRLLCARGGSGRRMVSPRWR